MAKQTLVVHIKTETETPQSDTTIDMQALLAMTEGSVRRIPKSEWLQLLGHTQNREKRAIRIDHYFLDIYNMRIQTLSTALQNVDITLDTNTQEIIVDLRNTEVSEHINQKLQIIVTFA